MAESCIVCLGDLATLEPPPRLKSEIQNSDGDDSRVALAAAGNLPLPTQAAVLADSETIAELLPCHHTLHNECLKPWVERANSCPICRQNFNMVELRATLQGPTLSAYAVEDKQQTAELDPTMVVEEDLYEDELQIEPCFVCEEFGDDEVLLLCDGCNISCHTFCCDLDSVPAGAWFCQYCSEEGLQAPPRRSRQRTRGRQRRLGPRRNQSPSAWARVWQTVFNRINLDLDFPFDDEAQPEPQRNPAHRRDFHEWQERFRVAERQGGAARFRDTAATLLDIRSGRPSNVDSQPESQEELRAWNAFDKAKELQAGEPSGGRNKRKSPTASPVEPSTVTERKLKRPRTRRAQDIADSSSERVAESSTRHGTSNVSTIGSSLINRARPDPSTAGPSFLQSLLKEVETINSVPQNPGYDDTLLNIVTSNPLESSLPASQSSASSPSNSNHPSPRPQSTTPPPFHVLRPSSPPLTSRIEPIFAKQPDYSPFSPAEHPPDLESDAISPTSVRPSRIRQQIAFGSSPQRSTETSPTRVNMSLCAKEEIQTMVKAALRPLYTKKTIDKDQYTDINRDISRMLYDRVGEAGGLTDERERERWKRVAVDEVDNAVKALKALKSSDAVAAA